MTAQAYSANYEAGFSLPKREGVYSDRGEPRLSGAGGGISELFSELRRIAASSGVTLERQAPAAGGDGPQSAARITVRGGARQVLAFLAALGDDPYPFVADELRLYPIAGTVDDPQVLQAELVVTSPRLSENPPGPSG